MQRERLTLARIAAFNCPADKKQAFLWDTDAPRLAIRATAGAKSFIFESKLDRQTIRRTIGDVRNWKLDEAREEARTPQEKALERGRCMMAVSKGVIYITPIK